MSNRRRILTAARAQVVEHGVGATTLVQVAERSGIDLAAVRSEFQDRHHLLVAVHEEVARELNGACLVAARSVPQEGFEPIVAGAMRLFEVYVADGPGRSVLHPIRQILTLREWNETDRRFGVSSLLGDLRPLAEQGVSRPEAIDGLAVIVYGLVTEACVSVADGLAVITPQELGHHVRAVLEAAAMSPGPGPHNGQRARASDNGSNGVGATTTSIATT